MKEYVNKMYEMFKQNRLILEDKWKRNEDNYRREDDTSYDDDEAWRSTTFIDVTKQKCVAGANLVLDMVIKDNSLPFGFQCDDLTATDTPEIRFTKLIRHAMIKANMAKEFTKGVSTSAKLGECTFKKVIDVDRMGMERMFVRYVSNYKIFRDYEVDHIQDGIGVFDREKISGHDLFLMKQVGDGWIDDAIAEVLNDYQQDLTTGATNLDSPRRHDIRQSGRDLEFLEAWLWVPRKMVESFGNQFEDDLLEDIDEAEMVRCLVCIVNDDHIVRFATMDQTERWPFFTVPWEVDPDRLESMGVADNVEVSQKVVNDTIRLFQDNKSLAGNVLLGVKRDKLEQDLKRIRPGMTVDLSEDCKNIHEAIQAFQIPDVGNGLIVMFDTFLQFADMSSNIPRAQQGQESAGAKTAYELSQLIEKSGKYIGSVIRNFDEYGIEEIVGSFAEHYLPEFIESERLLGNEVDETILQRLEPLGYRFYEQKILILQKIMQLLNIVSQSPELMGRIKKAPLLTEILKSVGMDASQFVYTDDEFSKQQEGQQQIQMQQVQLEMAKVQAEIEKLKAEALAIGYKQGQETIEKGMAHANAKNEQSKSGGSK